MRLHQVAQRADDLGRAVGFYRDTLGLPLTGVFDPPGLAFFDLGEVRLMLERGAPSSLLYMEVPDVAAAHDGLSARGVSFEGEPTLVFRDDEGQFGPAGTEEWMAFLRDSEGNLLGLVERREP